MNLHPVFPEQTIAVQTQVYQPFIREDHIYSTNRTGMEISRACTYVNSSWVFPSISIQPQRMSLGKGAKKNLKKNLTSVSFAFTHTYTAVKTNSFRFFPQAYMENFEKCAKTGNMGTLGGGGGANSPLWPRYHPIGFKTSTLKENCLLNYCWEKKRKNN